MVLHFLQQHFCRGDIHNGAIGVLAMKGMIFTAVMTLVVAIPLFWGGRVLLRTGGRRYGHCSNEEDERYTIDELIM